MRKFEHVKAVMFDLDNTLIVRAMSLAKVAKYAMRFFFPGREEEYPALEALFCRCYISGYDRHEECFYTFKAESGMDEGIAYPLFKKMWDFYYPFCTTRDPGVETVLRLKERGYNVSILTNGPLVQQNAKIDAAGFRPWFSEITVSEAIGVAKPVSIMVDAFGTSQYTNEQLTAAVDKVFDCRPNSIINQLELQKPQYYALAAYGHLGREELGVRWEQTDKAEALLAAIQA